MATYNHEVFANATTPLWAKATAGGQIASPSYVVNSLTNPQTSITTSVGLGQGSIALQSYPPTTPATPLNKISFDGVGVGVGISTNNVETYRSTPEKTTITANQEVDFYNRNTGNTVKLSNNQILYNDKEQITMGSNYTQIGDNTYTDATGLNVWNTGNASQWTNMTDNQVKFWTESGSTPVAVSTLFSSPFCPDFNATFYIYNNITDEVIQPLAFVAGSGTLTHSGSPPYTCTVANTGAIPTSLSFRWGTGGLGIPASAMPFLYEITMPDPAAYEYEITDITAGSSVSTLIQHIKNTSGVLTFDAINNNAYNPITYTAGDKVRILYEVIEGVSPPTAQVSISLNNVGISSLSFAYSPTSTTFTPFFQTQFSQSVPVGTSITLGVDLYTLSPVQNYKGFSWDLNKGGVYPNSLTTFVPSGTLIAGTWNSAFLIIGGRMQSPVYTQASAGASGCYVNFNGGLNAGGTGTYTLYHNGDPLVSNIPLYTYWTLESWSFTPSGNDTFEIQFNTADPQSVMSIQNFGFNYVIQNYSEIGAIGASGTQIGIGTGDIVTGTPQMVIDPLPQVLFNAPINMQSGNISNVGITNTERVTTDVLGVRNFSYVSVDGDLTFGGTGNIINVNNTTTSYLDCPAGTSNLTIGSNSSAVFLSNVSGLSVSSADIATLNSTNLGAIAGGNLYIGSNATATELFNVFTIGNPAAAGLKTNITSCGLINSSPACPVATMWYKNAAGAFVSIPIQPKRDGTANTFVFPNSSILSFLGVGTPMYITLPSLTSFRVTTGGVYGAYDNPINTPAVYTITAANFDFFSSSQFYQLVVL
jgi:hypothetical protein